MKRQFWNRAWRLGITLAAFGMLAAGGIYAAKVKAVDLDDFLIEQNIDEYLAQPGVRSRLSEQVIVVMDASFGNFAQDPSSLPKGSVLVEGLESHPSSQSWVKHYSRKFIAERIAKTSFPPANESQQQLLNQIFSDMEPLSEGDHGLKVAIAHRSVHEDQNDRRNLGPKYYLLNANGALNFLAAVRYAKTELTNHRGEKVLPDQIIYATNWPASAGKDGKRGHINRIVDELATLRPEKGMIWWNSAGNFGKRSYVDEIKIASAPENDQKKIIRIQSNPEENTIRFKNIPANNSIAIEVNWTSRNPNRGSGEHVSSAIDLDVEVYRAAQKKGETRKRIAQSEGKTVQVPLFGEKTENFIYARESILLKNLEHDTHYEIRIVVKTPERIESGDEFWVVFDSAKESDSGEDFVLLDRTERQLITNPGNNPYVITVGGPSFRSAEDRNTGKPEFITRDFLSFSDANTAGGTTIATAVLAGIASVLKAYHPEVKDQDAILDLREQMIRRADQKLSSKLYKETTRDEVSVAIRTFLVSEQGIRPEALSYGLQMGKAKRRAIFFEGSHPLDELEILKKIQKNIRKSGEKYSSFRCYIAQITENNQNSTDNNRNTDQRQPVKNARNRPVEEGFRHPTFFPRSTGPVLTRGTPSRNETLRTRPQSRVQRIGPFQNQDHENRMEVFCYHRSHPVSLPNDDTNSTARPKRWIELRKGSDGSLVEKGPVIWRTPSPKKLEEKFGKR